MVGITTAYFLARDGWEVTVVDRQPGAGLETSFANGGQISASHAEPWATPATLKKAWRWLGRKDAPLVFRWARYDPALWQWLARFLVNCTETRARENTERVLRVALYSRDVLKELRQETKLEYDQRTQGILHIYRNEKDFAQARAIAAVMAEKGLVREEKSPEACVTLEPALAHSQASLVGGLYSPADESGDAHKFTQTLAGLCTRMGVQFQFGRSVRALLTEKGRITGILDDKGRQTADTIVLALGSYSPLLARPLGLRLPIYPAKGYSVTLPEADPAKAPTVSLTDDENRLVFSRLGDRLRVAGTAELTGYNPAIDHLRARGLLDKALALFPDAGDAAQAVFWAGLRPVTPDSVPILGKTPIAGLYLNTGHGTLGWTMSCGSGRILADLISGHAPAISLKGLGLDRF